MKVIEIHIGEYRISIREHGDWWIDRKGEGMEITVAEIEAMISGWFNESF